MIKIKCLSLTLTMPMALSMAELILRSSLHELNNILAIIHSTSELLADDLGPTHPSKPDVNNIQDACKRGIVLVQNIREAVLEGQLKLS